MKKLIVSGFVMAACAAPAFADTTGGPYVGGGFGQFNLHIENLNDVGHAVSTIAHSDDDAWKLFAGWRFAPYLAVEGAYINLGHPGDTFTATGADGTYKVHMDGFAPSVIGSVPLGPIELFAKASYFYYNVNLKAAVSLPASAALQSSHSRSDFLYGGGVGMTFVDHLNIRAEYEQFDLANYRNSNTLWLAAAWRF
ncbi:MAG: outer membrane beta-barrel protein [Steroidobacteraceae bacterium]